MRSPWRWSAYRRRQTLHIGPDLPLREHMSRKIVAAAVLLALAVSAGLSLIGGASCLDAPLAGAVPLGNLLAAVGLCAMAGAAVVISTRGTGLRAAALAALAGAMLWLPVSVLLAGNLQLNFSGGRGTTWLVFSAAVFAFACLALLWGIGSFVLARVRGAGAG